MFVRLLAGVAVMLSFGSVPISSEQQNKRPPARPAEKFARYQVAAGTALLLKLRTAVDATKTQVDQQVEAVLWSPVVQDGVELVPTDSVVLGRVTAIERATWDKPLGTIAIVFAVVEHAETGDRATLNTRPLIFEATPPPPPPGKKAKPRPVDVVLNEGTSMVAVTTEPLVVRIPK